MGKVALRGLMAHKGRMLMTLLAVALGVAFISGVLTLTDTMNRSFDEMFASTYEGTDAVVRSSESIDDAFGETQRGTIDAGLVDEIAAVPTVAVAEGNVQGFAQVIDKEGDVYGGDPFGPPSMGASWATDDHLNVFDLREGRGPETAGEIAIDAATAKGTDYVVGDTVPVQTKQGVDEFALVGIAGFGSYDSPGGSNFIFFTREEAQEKVGDEGRFNDISAVATSGTSQGQLVSDIGAVLGSDLEVLSGEDIADQTSSDLKDQLSFITIFFLIFAIIAMVVGAFVIYNSFSIIVAQRTREMALLRSIGASRKQVRRAVLIEAVAVGIIGSLIGFVLGLGLALVLVEFMEIDGSLAVLPTAVATALICGLVVTVFSSLVPAWRASRVPPVAALRDVTIDTAGRSPVRWALGLGSVVLGIAAVIIGAFSRDVLIVGAGVAITFVGLLLAGAALAGPISTALGWPLGKARGVTGRLARQNAVRNPRRTASTAYALMIGVGIVAFFLILNASIRSSIDQVLDDTYAGDFMIDSGGFGTVGLPETVGEEVATLPEVETAVPLRFTQAVVQDENEGVTGTAGTAFDMFGLDVVEGTAELSPGEVVVRKGKADDLGLGIGDTVTVNFLDADRATVTVAGIYDSTPAAELGNYVIGIEEYGSHVTDALDNQVIIKQAAGFTEGETKAALEQVVDQFPAAEVLSNEDLKDQIGSQLDVMLQLIFGLLALAIIIALFGIANTIALSVLERTRELGLLRAVGATRSQLRSAIRWESVIIALFGTVLGLVVGILGGWGMVQALRDEGFEVFSLPFVPLTVIAVLAGGLGIMAALWPAWRTSRLNVLDAIQQE